MRFDYNFHVIGLRPVDQPDSFFDGARPRLKPPPVVIPVENNIPRFPLSWDILEGDEMIGGAMG